MATLSTQPGNVLLRAPNGRYALRDGEFIAPIGFFGDEQTPQARSRRPCDDAYMARMVADGWIVVPLSTDVLPASGPSSSIIPWPEDAPPSPPEEP